MEAVVLWWDSAFISIWIPIYPEFCPAVDLICSDGLQVGLSKLMIFLVNSPISPAQKMEERPRILLAEGKGLAWLAPWLSLWFLVWERWGRNSMLGRRLGR